MRPSQSYDERTTALLPRGPHRFLIVMLIVTGVFVIIAPAPTAAKSLELKLKVSHIYENIDPILYSEGDWRNVSMPLLRGSEDTTLAYPLSSAPIKLSGTYQPVPKAVVRSPNADRISWIVEHASDVGQELTPFYYRETAAIQAVVWSYHVGTELSEQTITDDVILQRARELREAADAASATDFRQLFINLNLDIDIQKATYKEVILEARLRDDHGNGLRGQALILGWDGKALPETRTDDRGVVTTTVPRPNRKVIASVTWNNYYLPGVLLVSDDPSSPDLVSAERLDVSLHSEIAVNPNDLTKGPDLLLQTVQDQLAKIGPFGHDVFPYLLIILLAAPYLAILWKVGRWLYARGRSPQPDDEAASHPPPRPAGAGGRRERPPAGGP